LKSSARGANIVFVGLSFYLSQAVRKKKKQLYNFIATEDRSKDGNQIHPSSQSGDRVKKTLFTLTTDNSKS